MATTQPSRDRSGPLRRLPSADFSTAEAIFEAAMTLLTPDDQTQRKAFEALMPYMYVLRNKGCSWTQLTKLLTDSGFVLQPSTVRSYYSEMLATRQDICQERMNEQILLLAELRKETKGVNVADIAGRVAAIMDQQRTQVTSKLDTVFGSVTIADSPTVAAVLPVATPAAAAGPTPPVTVAPQTENTKTALRPAPPNASPSVSPVNQKQADAAASRIEADLPPSVLLTGNWKCSPLPDGVKLLGERPGVDKEMYLPGDQEHPAVPGVWLSLDQRLSTVALEFVNTATGEIQLEDSDQKRFRVLWRKPVAPFKTRTEGCFTKMNHSLFK